MNNIRWFFIIHNEWCHHLRFSHRVVKSLPPLIGRIRCEPIDIEEKQTTESSQ
jgi:hypothetical protein